MADFGLSIKKFVEKTKRDMNETIKFTAIELFRSVIMDTPVDEGRLRANWFCTIAKASDRVDFDPDGIYTADSEIINRMISKISGAPKATQFYLTNNLPYAYRIEYEGWSSQAPQGMVRRNVNRLSAILDEQAKKVV